MIAINSMKNKQTIPAVTTNLTQENIEKFKFKLENEILDLISLVDYEVEEVRKINSNPKINFNSRIFNNN